MKQSARWMAIFEGRDDESPIDRLTCEFTADGGSTAEEYMEKIERRLSPAIRPTAGPIPLNMEAYQ
jgi:hypothetical protein